MRPELNRIADGNVYLLAAGAIRDNWPVLLTIVLAQASLQTLKLSNPDIGDWATLLRGWLQIPLMFIIVATILQGGAMVLAAMPWARFWGFFWRLLLLGAPAAVVMTTADQPGLFTLGIVGAAGLVLATFGTVLPDSVAGGGSFRKAARRGFETLKPFLIWMFAGPVGATLVLMALVALVGGAVAGLAIVTGVPLTEGDRLLLWFAGLLALLGALLSATTATLVAAVLCKVWALARRHEAGFDTSNDRK